MGRALKRVPLDFDAPLNKLWKGYVNPYHMKDAATCSLCDGEGLNLETLLWRISWDYHLSISDPKRDYLQGNIRERDYRLLKIIAFDNRQEDMGHWMFRFSEEEFEELKKVDTRRFQYFFSHAEPFPERFENFNSWLMKTDNYEKHTLRYAMTKIRTKRLGVFGDCEACNGEGNIFRTPEHRQAAEDWVPTDPPSGNGFQLWETTSEGSPVSPVFEELADLCAWCAKNATTFGSFTATKEEWEQMLSKQVFVVEKNGMAFV